MKIATLNGATSYEQLITFLPECLIIHSEGFSFPNTLRITVAGNIVVCDLDFNAMLALSEIQRYQSPIANVSGDSTFKSLIIPLANGIIKGVNVQISLTMSSVEQSCELFAWAQQPGEVIVQSLRTTVLANSGQTFEDFGYLVVEEMQDSDVVNIDFTTGINHPSHRQELLADETNYGNQYLPITSVTVNNLARRYSKFHLIPTNNRTVVVTRFVPFDFKGV